MRKKPSTGKTPHMLYLENRYHKPIEALLTEGSLRQVSKKLGISHTTVNNWLVRLRLGVNTNANS